MPTAISISSGRVSVDRWLKIVEVEKLSQSQGGSVAAYAAGIPLQQNGWMRFPPACWDQQAILAFTGKGICVAGLNFKEDEDDFTLNIAFAFCDPRYPNALALLLSRFRKKYRGSKFSEIRFTCHEGNEPMAKAVKMFGLTPSSHSYRMPIARLG
jgi:hypothetical protein